MANTENLQDLILNEVRREHTAVTMFLMCSPVVSKSQ